MSKHALVFVSDIHCGSTVGLMHPDGVIHDDGQTILPSRPQEYLWEKWQQFKSDVRALVGGYHTHVFLNGDLTDGDHHRTHQIVSNDQGLHIQIAADCLMDFFDGLSYNSIHCVRGTPSHVGKASGLEKSVMGRLNREGVEHLVRDPHTNSFVWPFVYADIGGLLFDIRHHGRAGQREHTRRGYASLYGNDIWMTHVVEGRQPPDISVRAHLHKFMDSGHDHRGVTRVVQMPCWQLHTEWTRRISIESMPDIGGVVILVEKGRAMVEPLLYKPEADPQRVWRPAV